MRAEEIAKGPNNRFALYHPLGGRQVFNPDEPNAVETLKKLEAQGWCESPLEFWDAEKVESRTVEGFFDTKKPIPASYQPTSGTSRGDKGSTLQGLSGDPNDRDREELASETSIESGDKLSFGGGSGRSKILSKKKSTLVV